MVLLQKDSEVSSVEALHLLHLRPHIVLCRKASLTAADLKVPQRTSAGILAGLQSNKSAASQAALEQREAHRLKDAGRRRKQLKVQLPEGCGTAHNESHGLLEDVAQLYTQHAQLREEADYVDLREDERRGATHGKLVKSSRCNVVMGAQTREALSNLSSSLDEWQYP